MTGAQHYSGWPKYFLDAVSGIVRLRPEEKQDRSKDNALNFHGLDVAKFSSVVPKSCLLNFMARKNSTVVEEPAWSQELT